MDELTATALGLTCILQIIIVTIIAAKVRRMERTQNEHARHLFALNQLDRAMARQIGLVRREIYRLDQCPCHSGYHCLRPSPRPRGERTTGDGQQ